jgi:enamine deaminase RidA (YjgF/YER057c/UK114 family)
MPASRKTSINPAALFNSTQYGFSQITVTQPGRHIFISGQVAWDEHLNITGKDDLGIQTRKALENVKTAMECAGGTLEDIVMLRIYKVKYTEPDGSVIHTALREVFGTVNPPCSTWISVDGLANADFMIEIEAQAVI